MNGRPELQEKHLYTAEGLFKFLNNHDKESILLGLWAFKKS